MIITANFTNKGVPQDGLTPSIRIIQIPSTVEVSGTAMTEITDLSGAYYYDFTGYNVTGDYHIKCDGGDTLSDYDRYTWGVNSDDLEVGTGIDDISGGVAAIQIKTDNLPADTSGEILIIQGLLHSNIYTDPVWVSGLMTGSLIKIYDSKANAITHGAGGLLATFSMTGTFVDGVAETILMVRET